MRLASVNRLGTESPNGTSTGGPVSVDGRFAVFLSNADDVIQGVTGTQLYWRDLDAGTSRLVTRSLASGAGSSGSPTGFEGLSPSGQLLYFRSTGSDLADGDLNLASDVFAFEPIDEPTRTPMPVRTPTPISTPTFTPPSGSTATPVALELAGDCDGDGVVVVYEIVNGVRIRLGLAALAVCPDADADGDQAVSAQDLRQAVSEALAL